MLLRMNYAATTTTPTRNLQSKMAGLGAIPSLGQGAGEAGSNGKWKRMENRVGRCTILIMLKIIM